MNDKFPLTQDINSGVSGHVETVCLLGKRKPDAKVKLSVDMDDYYRIINGKDEKG
jgi:site-specific DNA recombinase